MFIPVITAYEWFDSNNTLHPLPVPYLLPKMNQPLTVFINLLHGKKAFEKCSPLQQLEIESYQTKQ